jgi:hypothetical protein
MSAFRPFARAMSRPALLVALTVLALPHVALADTAAPLVSSAATLGNLHISLIDLDPNDGITPGLTINNAKGFVGLDLNATSFPTSQTPADYQGSLLPATAVSRSDAISSASATPDSITLTTRITLDQALGMATTISLNDPSSDYLTGIRVNRYSTVSDPEQVNGLAGFTLTPHTALQITGRADLYDTLDTTALRTWASAQGYTGYNASESHVVNLAAMLLPEITLQNETDLYDYSLAHPEAVFSAFLPSSDANLSNEGGDTFTDQLLSQDMSIRFDNVGDTALNGYVILNVSSSQDVSITANKPPVVVPEPASVTLMALGLVGLALARRRTR